MSKLDVSRLLSFSKMDEDIFQSISDFSNISSRTAAEINRMANKGGKYKIIIISLSDKIMGGSLGARSLEKIIENSLKPKKEISRDIFKGNNIEIVQNGEKFQLNFSKSIIDVINDKTINMDNIIKIIDDYVEGEIGKYPRGY
jgi:UDP-N-acetylglucosamine:LPS N-acetylglucosamine transferase